MARIVLACICVLAAAGCRSSEGVVTTTKSTSEGGEGSTVAEMTLSSGGDSSSSTGAAPTSSGSETTGEVASSTGYVTGSSGGTTGVGDGTTVAGDDTTGDTGGSCAAEVLADELGGPWAFSRQGDSIYFTTNAGESGFREDDAGVWRVPVDGGIPELLVGDLDGWGIVTTPTSMYWSLYQGEMMRANLDGGDSMPFGIGARPIAVDATHVYAATTIYVGRYTLAGGPFDLLVDATDEGEEWYGAYEMALDDQRVYWTTGKSLESVGKDGSGRLTLAVDQEYAAGVASDGEHVFWIDINNLEGCQLRRVPVTGGAYEVLWTATPAPLTPRQCSPGTAKIALDDEYVYWGGDLVQRIPKAGGAVEVVTDCGVLYLRDIMVDDTHVYWINWDGVCLQGGSCLIGELMRVAKPA